jgi:hypothetical protein
LSHDMQHHERSMEHVHHAKHSLNKAHENGQPHGDRRQYLGHALHETHNALKESHLHDAAHHDSLMRSSAHFAEEALKAGKDHEKGFAMHKQARAEHKQRMEHHLAEAQKHSDLAEQYKPKGK